MTEGESDVLRAREIRVFLSSTFLDMEAERTHLVKEVFPKIRAVCAERMVGFTEIDLRWGITEEESRNGETIEICLAEIDRCRAFPPFFIGFLGERYGWIPEESDLEQFWSQRADSDYAPVIRDALERGKGVTEVEMELAAMADGAAQKLQGQVLFLLRDRSLTEVLQTQAAGGAFDATDKRFFDAAGGKLDALKDRIRCTPYLAIDGYHSIEEFGEAVEAYLLEQIAQFFPEDEAPTPLEQSGLAHLSFRHHRLRNYVPRDDVKAALVGAMSQRIVQPALGPVVLCGPSGQGKSAVLADLSRQLDSGEKCDVHWRVIDHYVGADGSLTLDAWLERVMQMLHPELRDAVGDEIPTDPKKRRETLSDWLTRAAQRTEQKIGRPVRFALIVDALDQLLDEGKDLQLLSPSVIGPSAVVVASAVDQSAAATTSAARGLETVLLSALTENEARAIAGDLLASYRKTLPENLINGLVRAPQAKNPLFLKLALEELRLDARHETLNSTLDKILSCADPAQLFVTCFLCDTEYQRDAQPDLSLQFFALQAAAYQGLSELELAELLALPGDPVAEDTGKPRTPQVVMSKLAGVFWPFMLTKEGRHAPMHRVLGQAALQAVGEEATRERLYKHFRPGYGDKKRPMVPRAAAEALFQLERLQFQRPSLDGYPLSGDVEDIYLPARLIETHQTVVNAVLEMLGRHEVGLIAQEDWVRQLSTAKDSADYLEVIIIRNFATFLHERGFLHAASHLRRWLTEVLEGLLGAKHKETLTAKHNLALTCLLQNDLETAGSIIETVVRARRELLGPEARETLNSMSTLAGVRIAQNRLAEARETEEQVLELYKRWHGLDDTGTLTAMNNLALTLNRYGNAQNALALQKEVLQRRQSVLGNEHRSTFRAMMNLAVTLSQLDRHEEARPLAEHALGGLQRMLGEEHPETLRSLQNLGNMFRREGNLPRALDIHKAVYVGLTLALGGEHPDTIKAKADEALVLAELGQTEPARKSQELVLEDMRNALGENHYRTLRAMSALAMTLLECDEDDDALKLQEEALRRKEAILSADHPDTLISRHDLAMMHLKKGDMPRALSLQKQAVEAMKVVFGTDDPQTLAAQRGLAEILYQSNDLASAQRLQEELLDVILNKYGPADASTIAAKHSLVMTLHKKGDFPRSRALIESLLSEISQSGRADNVDHLEVLESIGFILEQQDDKNRAVEVWKENLGIAKRLLGPEDSYTVNSMLHVSQKLLEEMDIVGALKIHEELLEEQRNFVGGDHPSTQKTLAMLVETLKDIYSVVQNLREKGLHIPATTIQEALLETCIRVLGFDNRLTLQMMRNLAIFHFESGDLPSSSFVMEQYVEKTVLALGSSDPLSWKAMHDFAVILFKQDKLPKAQEVLETLLRVQLHEIGEDHSETRRTIEFLQQVYEALETGQ